MTNYAGFTESLSLAPKETKKIEHQKQACLDGIVRVLFIRRAD
jgi:hypothetical protein